MLGQEVVAALDLQIDFAPLLGRRKCGIGFLGLVGDFVWLVSLAESPLLEVGQESFPILVLQTGIFG